MSSKTAAVSLPKLKSDAWSRGVAKSVSAFPFRDSAVTNLMEFFEKFRRLNVRSNQELDQLVEQAQQLVQGVTPQDLRTNDELRTRIASQMSQVQTQLDNLLVERPRRQIVRQNPLRNGGNHATGD